MQIIPINNGYYNYKSINGQIFKSRLMEVPYENYMTSSDIITFEGVTYVAGAGEPQMEMNKLKDNFTKILILNMLAKFCKKEKENFKLVLSMPPLVYYKDDFTSDQFVDYIKGTYDIVWNKKPLHIIIEDAKVIPETFVAYSSVNALEDYDNKIVYIIDIGGYATNVCRIVNNDFNAKDFITVQDGMYHVDSAISQRLNATYIDYNLNCDFEDVEHYRKHGLSLDGEVVENWHKQVEDIEINYIKGLLSKCKTAKFNLKSGAVIVTGGGGESLFPIIKNQIKHAELSTNPLWDNLIGLNIMAQDIFND